MQQEGKQLMSNDNCIRCFLCGSVALYMCFDFHCVTMYFQKVSLLRVLVSAALRLESRSPAEVSEKKARTPSSAVGHAVPTSVELTLRTPKYSTRRP